jgi:DNA modification methylase
MVISSQGLSKEYIDQLVKTNPVSIYHLLKEANNNGALINILEKIGRLPTDFDGTYFLPFLHNNDDTIRFLAVKNIGKLGNDKYLESMISIVKEDPNSNIRREAVSSIGRMHSRNAIPFLFSILSDNDPKVILQSIRALLVFKSDPNVVNSLIKFQYHPNETVQYVIQKEFAQHTPQKPKMKHVESPDYMKNTIVHGDVREILKYVPDESVHLTFTSPPYYNARDYSIYQSYNQYMQFLENVFKEVYRITKEGRFFILNTSPIIIPRFSRQHASKRYPIPYDIHYYLIKMGWEFIDDIIWLKPEACAKNRNAGFLMHRKPLAYKPNAITESIMVYRKKTDKLLDWCMRQYDNDIVNKSRVKKDYETSNVWKIDPIFDRNHSAVFPVELCNRVIEFYSYAGDLIFDPFAGSGTLGRAAISHDRFFFLTEKELKYIELMGREIVYKSLWVNQKPRILDTNTFKEYSKKRM